MGSAVWLYTLSPIMAQDIGWVKGVVTDGQTGKPLPGAVVVYGAGMGTLTSGDGLYHLRAPAGPLSVSCRFIGYREVIDTVTVPLGDTLRLDFRLFQQVTEMDRVVVSAGRAEQRLSDLTVSMSLIRPGEISATHTSNAQELIGRISGLEVLDGQASIRGGSGFSYGAGSRVLVLIDGLPMLSADAGHVRWHALPFENLEQVEVIKGASSVMYGSSALNGIINFRTKEATTDGVTQFYAEAGMFGKPAREEWIWWNSPRYFSSLSASHSRRYGSTDLSTGVFVQHDLGYRRLNEDHFGRFNLMLRHRNQKVEGLTYGIALNSLHNRKQDFVLWEDAEEGALRQQTVTAQKLHGSSLSVDPFVRLRQNQAVSHDFRSRVQLTRNDYPEDGANNSDGASIYTAYQFLYKPAKVVQFNTGVLHYRSRVLSAFYGDHQAINSALYLQAEITPTERLKMVAGGRVEQFALDQEEGVIIPLFRAGLNYRVGKATFLRTSFGQGFRYPSIAEKFASTTLGSVRIIPNPDVKPESGWNTELALKQGVQSRLFNGVVDLALFYGENQDMIEFVFRNYEEGLGFRATNVEFARIYGIELEFYLISSIGHTPLTWTGGYVYMHPVEVNPHTGKNTDRYLKFRRKHAFNLNLSSSWKRIEATLYTTLRSGILDIDDVFVNPSTREDILPGFYDYWTSHNRGYFLLDIAVAYPLSSQYKISLAVKNLNNTEYMGRPGDIRPHRHLSLRFTGRLPWFD
jgi:outer membrane receptor protein involved in Fe transport